MHPKTPVERVAIDLGDRSYDIVVGAGLLDRAESFGGLPKARDAVIVTNEVVGPLLSPRLSTTLQSLYPRVSTITLPDGESHKDLTTLNTIFDSLLERSADRQTTLFALGGGVVGDMTGFAAACYMRGVPYVQVPTTLLSQVDSSVGGKTAVNHPLGKNMIGVFNQPVRVVADLSTLETLPQRELVAGLAEVIKYGLIADAEFLSWIDVHLESLLAREKTALAYAVKRSCEIKAAIVAEDERESGLRAVLNFGHTFGHAIETGLGYGEWLHGEAVGCGMVMAADLSMRLGRLSSVESKRVQQIVERAGLPTVGPQIGVERYLELMRLDKKSTAGEIRFVVIGALGSADVRGAPNDLVKQVIRANT